MTAYGLNALRLNVATRRFFAGASGNSVVEYALLLAIIAGALLTAATVVGFVARDTLSVAGATVGGNISADADGADNSAAPRQPPRSTTSALPAISLYTVSYVQLGVVAIVVLLSGLLWSRLRKTHGAKGQEQEGAEPEYAEPRLNHDAIFEKRQAIYNILTNDMQAMFESRILVGHLMSRHVTKVAPGDATDDVVELMREKRLRHLLVCDRDGRLLGIISDRDLAKSSAGTAAELMTRDPITVEPDTLVSPAVTLLIQRRISCLPVVDSDGVLRGVLTTTDLMMTLQCAMQILQRIAKEVKSPLREPEATTISSVCA
jgi:CBS domain-containing protein/Flp pilus assembly pilin Flp